MISRFGGILSRVFGRFMPDPFVIAVLLSVCALVLALGLGDFPGKPPEQWRIRALLEGWRSSQGLWTFLSFSMQMCLVLVSGHALAASGPVRRMLERLAAMPRSGAAGAAMAAGIACLCSLLNWGLGLIAGAFLAREIGRSLARRNIPHHYPVLVAAGFAGFLPWHGGLSGSAPLTMTSAESMAKVLPPSTIAAMTAAGHDGGVSLGRTIFSSTNLIITGGLLVMVPVCAALLMPRASTVPATSVSGSGDDSAPRPPSPGNPREHSRPITRSSAEFLEASRLINLLLGAALLAGFASFLYGPHGITPARLQRMGLNEINTAMLGLGLLLHASPRSYLAAVEDAARGCAGILLQFPLYGGIVAILSVSGLDRQIATALSEHASARSLPVFTFWSAGVLNIFIPSGGGQWGVQGPIALESGLALGVPPGKMVLCVAYGDQLTNMLQPFWALPLLAITGARARDIVGYTAIVMLVALAWISAMLWLL